MSLTLHTLPELGAIEAGLKQENGTGTKELIESQLKLPKELTDMLVQINHYSPEITRQINIVGHM